MNNIYKRILGVLVIALVCYFFIKRISNSWDEINSISNFSITLTSIFGLVLFVLAVLISSLLWGKVLNYVSSLKIGLLSSMKVHTGAWLLKYIPGQIGAVLYKVKWGQDNGYKKSEVGLSFIYENLFLTIASTLPMSLILLYVGGFSTLVTFGLVFIFLLSLMLLLSKPVIKKFFSLLSKKVNIKPKDLRYLERNDIAFFSTLYILPRIVNGLGFVAISASLYAINTSDILPLIAAYSLAGIIGIYAIFVPSGLGVREAFIVIFTSSVLTAEQAVIVAIAARFYATITDAILAIIYSSFNINIHRLKS